jgi:hypothetical protein
VQTTAVQIVGQDFGHIVLAGAQLEFNVPGIAISLRTASFPHVGKGLKITSGETLVINLQENSTLTGEGTWSVQNSGSGNVCINAGHGSILGLGVVDITFGGATPWYGWLSCHVNSTIHIAGGSSITFGGGTGDCSGIQTNGGSAIILNHVSLNAGSLPSGGNIISAYLNTQVIIWGCTFTPGNTAYDLKLSTSVGSNRIDGADAARCNLPSGTVQDKGIFMEIS